MMKYIPPLLTIILLISCSKKSIDDDMTVYSFDGEYNLCQNWYAPKNVFDKNEKNNYWLEYEGACNVPITIENNAFNWNYDGSLIDCFIVSRQDEYGIFPKQLGLCDHPDAIVFELKHEVDELWFIKIDNYSNYSNFKIVLNKISPRPFKKELMAIDDYINPNYDFKLIIFHDSIQYSGQVCIFILVRRCLMLFLKMYNLKLSSVYYLTRFLP